MEQIIPSQEQSNIIDIIQNGHNSFVNAVPGAGKSTLSYLIATKLKDKSILSITYSKSLKMESRLKIDELHIDNIVIHSYHSFAMKYYKLPYSNSLIKNACINTGEVATRLGLQGVSDIAEKIIIERDLSLLSEFP